MKSKMNPRKAAGVLQAHGRLPIADALVRTEMLRVRDRVLVYAYLLWGKKKDLDFDFPLWYSK